MVLTTAAILAQAAGDSDTPTWMVQLGIAVPFVLALGFLGRWLLVRLDRVEGEKNGLYEKIITDVVPALKTSADLGEKVIEQQQELATTRASYVERLENTVKYQEELLKKSEELRLAEIKQNRKRGGE